MHQAEHLVLSQFREPHRVIANQFFPSARRWRLTLALSRCRQRARGKRSGQEAVSPSPPPLRTARARCPACRSRRLTGCDAWAGSWAMACGMAPWAVRSVVTAPGVHGDEGMERDRLPSEPGGSTPRTWPTLGFGSPRARAACGHAVTIPHARGWPRRSAVVHALWDPSGGGAPRSCGAWDSPPGRTVSALAFPASHPTRPGGRQPPGRVGLSTCLGGPIPPMTGWPALPPTASTPGPWPA